MGFALSAVFALSLAPVLGLTLFPAELLPATPMGVNIRLLEPVAFVFALSTFGVYVFAMGLAGNPRVALPGQAGGFVLLSFMAIIISLLGTSAFYYWGLSLLEPSQFSEMLSRPDAFYFAVTTLTTTGFGDITPTWSEARYAVTAQMLTGFLFVVFGVALAIDRFGRERPR